MQTVLPGAATNVYAATPAIPEQDTLISHTGAESTSDSPPTQTDTPTEPSTDGLFDDVEIVPPSAESDPIETALPVPLLLRLETSSHFIRPGETIDLTINAWRATEEDAAKFPYHESSVPPPRSDRLSL